MRWTGHARRSAAGAGLLCASGLLSMPGVAHGLTRAAQLRWQPSPDAGIWGYRIYTRTLGGAYGAPANVGLLPADADGTVSYVVAGLDSATSYVFAVTAYLATGIESPLSNELALLSDTATTTLTVTTTSTVTSTSTTTSTSTIPRPTTTTVPAPASSPCSGATDIPAVGGTFTGTTSGTSRQDASCVTTGTAPERVYRWTPALSGTATISTCDPTATTFDTVLYLLDGTCSGAQLACNDDTPGCGTTTDPTNPHRGSRITPTVVAGQTYFIVVDGYAGAQGTFALTVIPPSTPNPCGGATVIPSQGGRFVDTTSGTSRQDASCVTTGTAPERVYQWTPALSGTATISTCDATATTFDTVLYLLDGTCSGAQLACNDDTTGCGTTTDPTNPHRGSRITPTVVAGQTYFIVVDGYAGAQGTFALTVAPPAMAALAAARAAQPSAIHVDRTDEAACVPPNPCQLATRDPASGSTLTARPDGTPSESDDPCQAGICTGAACGTPAGLAGTTVHELDVRRFLLLTAGDRSRLMARAVFRATSAVDPTATGLSLELRAPDGGVLYRADLEGGDLRANRRRRTFRYARRGRATRPSAAGLEQLTLRRRGDTVDVALKATPSHLSIDTKVRLTWVLRLGSECARDPGLTCREAPGQITCSASTKLP